MDSHGDDGFRESEIIESMAVLGVKALRSRPGVTDLSLETKMGSDLRSRATTSKMKGEL